LSNARRPRGADSERNQRVHVRGAVARGGPRATVECQSSAELQRGGDNESRDPRRVGFARLQIHHERGADRAHEYPIQVAAHVLAIERTLAGADRVGLGARAIAGSGDLCLDLAGSQFVVHSRGEGFGGEVDMRLDDSGERRDRVFNRGRAIRAVHPADSEPLEVFLGLVFVFVERFHRVKPKICPAYR